MMLRKLKKCRVHQPFDGRTFCDVPQFDHSLLWNQLAVKKSVSGLEGVWLVVGAS